MRVLAIVPAHDEAPAIADVVAELRAAKPELDIVVIDDCSTDDTGARARAAGAPVHADAWLRRAAGLGAGLSVSLHLAYTVLPDYTLYHQVIALGEVP